MWRLSHTATYDTLAQRTTTMDHLKTVGTLSLLLLALFLAAAPFQPMQKKCHHKSIIVFSDIDDTLICSNARHHAGVDRQYPHSTVYPGAVAFEVGLSRGPSNLRAKPVVLLSARPKKLSSFLGISPTSPVAVAFRELNSQHDGDVVVPTTIKEGEGAAAEEAAAAEEDGGGPAALDLANAQYGRFRDFLPSKFIHLFNSSKRVRERYINIGRTKLKNLIATMEEPDRLDSCLAFVGDSGQGDELVARTLVGQPGSFFIQKNDPIITKKMLRRIASSFVHDVDTIENLKSTHGFALNSSSRGSGYTRFRSYPEAAAIALTQGAISWASLESVVVSVEKNKIWLKCKKARGGGGGGLGGGLGGETDEGEEEKEPCGVGFGADCCVELRRGMESARAVLYRWKQWTSMFPWLKILFRQSLSLSFIF